MQWRKLFDLNPLFAVLSDRVAARDFIAARIGKENLIPLLWTGADPERIPLDTLEPPYVIKSSHASGHVIFVGPGDRLDAEDIRRRIRPWLDYCHGEKMVEPGYVNVPHGFVVERQALAADGTRPMERRLFVFGGCVRAIQTTAFEEGRLRSVGFHTRDWTRLRWWLKTPFREVPPPRAKRLDDMIALAERLGQGLDHLRVDFYDCGDSIWVGELTVYSWSGLSPIHPEGADYIFGSYWRVRAPLIRAAIAVLLRRREIRPPVQPRHRADASRGLEGDAFHLKRRRSATPWSK